MKRGEKKEEKRDMEIDDSTIFEILSDFIQSFTAESQMKDINNDIKSYDISKILGLLTNNFYQENEDSLDKQLQKKNKISEYVSSFKEAFPLWTVMTEKCKYKDFVIKNFEYEFNIERHNRINDAQILSQG